MVVSILLAAGAIVVPFTLRELDRRQAVLLEDRLSMLVQFARVESRRSGVPIEVLIDADGRRVEARRLDVDRLGEGGIAASDPLDETIVDEASGDADDPDRFASAWARHDLEDGRLVPPRAVEDSAAFGDPGPFASLEFEAEDDARGSGVSDPIEDPWPDRVRLAVFFPDGTSVSTTPVVLESPRGDRRWTIDPWSGRSTFESDAVDSAEGPRPSDDLEDDPASIDEPADLVLPGSNDEVEAGVRP